MNASYIVFLYRNKSPHRVASAPGDVNVQMVYIFQSTDKRSEVTSINPPRSKKKKKKSDRET